MATGDGLLVRLRPVDRELTAAALEGLADAAARFGNGRIEVTARGSLQIRGLTSDSVEPFTEAVAALDMELAEGVPVETGPLAGLDPAEVADPRPVAAAIRRRIAASGLAARLGPKVSVVVDGGGALHLDAVPADIRLCAAAPGSWRIAVGVDEACATDPVDAAMRALGAAAGGGGKARNSAAAHRPPAEPVGSHPLRNGSFAVGLGLPFGQAEATMLRDLAGTARSLFRLAPARALLAVGIAGCEVPALVHKAGRLGFVVDPTDPRRTVAACPGCPACASGEIPARTLAREIAQKFTALLDGSITLHVSGCGKGCAHPRAAALAVVGVSGGCELRLDDRAVAVMPQQEAMLGLALLADVVARKRAARETVAGCLGRIGPAGVARLLQGHRHG
jgi:precorrin-3B synthase